LAFLALVLTGCNAAPAALPTDTDGTTEALTICGAHLEDRLVDVEIEGMRVSAVLDAGQSTRCSDAGAIDAGDYWLAPAFIDSHVHLAFYSVADKISARGIAATVDLAVPLDELPTTQGPLHQRFAGPMLTAPTGYPTQSWGVGGFGLEVDGPDAGANAVDQLAAAGASVIKVPLQGTPRLDEATITAIVERAHGHELPVAMHAMNDADALLAAELGADILAHTPTSSLSPPTIAAWSERTVISTLAAFGSTETAITNLEALHDGGARVLYGTDLGNSRELGIQSAELDALVEAGFSGREIIEMGTRTPADLWSWPQLGHIEAGAEASLLLLEADPHDAW
jgi:imidazolonepropionase-like amidohydrolase